jgi:hypothetical protein
MAVTLMTKTSGSRLAAGLSTATSGICQEQGAVVTAAAPQSYTHKVDAAADEKVEVCGPAELLKEVDGQEVQQRVLGRPHAVAAVLAVWRCGEG